MPADHGLTTPVQDGHDNPTRLQLILEQDRSWYDARGNHHAVEEMDREYLGNLLGWLQQRRVDIRRMAADYLGDPGLVRRTRVAEWIEEQPLVARLREELAARGGLGEDDGIGPRGLTGPALHRMIEDVMAEPAIDPALERIADEDERSAAPRRPLPRASFAGDSLFGRSVRAAMEERERQAMRADALRAGARWCDAHQRELEHTPYGPPMCPSCAYGEPPVTSAFADGWQQAGVSSELELSRVLAAVLYSGARAERLPDGSVRYTFTNRHMESMPQAYEVHVEANHQVGAQRVTVTARDRRPRYEERFPGLPPRRRRLVRDAPQA